MHERPTTHELRATSYVGYELRLMGESDSESAACRRTGTAGFRSVGWCVPVCASAIHHRPRIAPPAKQSCHATSVECKRGGVRALRPHLHLSPAEFGTVQLRDARGSQRRILHPHRRLASGPPVLRK